MPIDYSKYTLINNKTGDKYNYSFVMWNIAWVLVFILGIMTGAILF